MKDVKMEAKRINGGGWWVDGELLAGFGDRSSEALAVLMIEIRDERYRLQTRLDRLECIAEAMALEDSAAVKAKAKAARSARAEAARSARVPKTLMEIL